MKQATMISYEFDDYDFTMCDDGLCSKRKQCQRYALWQRWLADESGNMPQLVLMLLHADDEPVGDDCKLFWQITTKTV